MDATERKKHWENIYNTKQLHEVSWYQSTPITSLELIKDLNVQQDANIIDIGGGDSYLAGHLLELGYHNVTVLDISEAALDRAKKRLDEKAKLAQWIVADAGAFSPKEQYDVWHDRAAFHFLTDTKDVQHYVKAAADGVNPGGYLIIGTFSDEGPKKCSGLEIQQYSEETMTALFEPYFTQVSCEIVDHQTPFDTEQRFIFCCFQRKA